jgi:hypothetical protein
VLKEKITCQFQILYLEKMSFSCEEKIFSNKGKLRESVANRLTLKILKEILQTERK